MHIRLTQLLEHTPEMSPYANVEAFSLIIIGLFSGRFKAMLVFAAPVLLFILNGFIGIKHIYATAVSPSSYQTHVVVMGPECYSNEDFLKLGLPVILVYSLTVLLVQL